MMRTETRPDVASEELYKDDGCEVHPKCLTCPLAQCVFDTPDGHGLSKWRYEQRTKMVKAAYAEGVSIREIAIRFRIGVRTVQRDLVKPGLPKNKKVP